MFDNQGNGVVDTGLNLDGLSGGCGGISEESKSIQMEEFEESRNSGRVCGEGGWRSPPTGLGGPEGSDIIGARSETTLFLTNKSKIGSSNTHYEIKKSKVPNPKSPKSQTQKT